jgi:hypothetical protein
VLELAAIYGWRAYHPFLSKWSEKGFPDLTLIRTRDRRLLFAELKRDGGKLTEHQASWLDDLREVAGTPPRQAFEVYLWRPADWDDVQAVLR